MQKHYQSRNREYAAGDIFLNFLGYWTDRGMRGLSNQQWRGEERLFYLCCEGLQ